MKVRNSQDTIHLIGIGGIGVSALAKYHLNQGATISGSDLTPSEITKELEKLGAKILIGKHKKAGLPKGMRKVIYTPAVSKDNPELKEARRRKIKVQSYPEAVGDLTRQYKTITVSGAHGKSTTTAMTALVLEEGYLDPTVIVGTKVKEFGDSNFRKGFGRHLVLEADEWNKSFLNYSPEIAVVTNIDAEHLDTYKNMEAVEKAFGDYISRAEIVVANADDIKTVKVAKKFGKKVKWYSLAEPEAKTVARVLKIPGWHNVSNALAALKVGRILGVGESAILRALSRYGGAWRRFEFKGIKNGVFVFSDYGHHPREIISTLSAARSRFPLRRIWCVYQPHQQQRLKYLWNDFIGAFDSADRVGLLPVYEVAGRERIGARGRVNSKKLVKELLRRGKNAEHLESFDKAEEFINSQTRVGDVVLVMGAGDVHNLAGALVD